MSKTPEKTTTKTERVTTTTVEKKIGAGPAIAAHSKDAASSGTSGQDAKATTKKADQ